MTLIVVLASPNTAAAPDAAPRRIVNRFDAITLDVVYIERDEATAIPYFWMEDVPIGKFESAVAEIADIELVERYERTDEGAFYKAEWTVDSPLVHCIAAANGIVLEAQGTPAEWRLKVWFEARSSASSFQECCTAAGVPLTVHRLESIAEYFDSSAVSLTQRQREALALAYGEGYFDEPRTVSQAELADQLGISSSAFGRRLRRGIETVLGEVVIEDP